MVEAYKNEVINREANEWSKYRDELTKAKDAIAKEIQNLQGGAIGAGTDPSLNTIQSAEAREPNSAEPGTMPLVTPPPTTGDPDQIKRARFPMLVNSAFTLEMTTIPEIDRRVNIAKSELEALKAQIQKVLEEPVPDELKASIQNSDADYKAAVQKAKRLSSEYEQKINTVKNPSAPALMQLQRDAEQAEIAAAKLLDDKVKQAVGLARQSTVDQLMLEQSKLERSVKILEADRTQQSDKLVQLRREIDTMPPALVPESMKPQDTSLKQVSSTEIASQATGNLYSTLIDQLNVVKLNIDNRTRIKEFQQPSTPSIKEPMKRYMFTGLGVLLGFGLVAAGVIGLEFLQMRVSSLTQVRSTTTTPVVGVLPWLPDETTSRDPIKRADMNESIDKLRTMVAHSWLSRGATSLTVTSPLGDEGKSFTAFGLASSLAQAGYKTLLVDFDLREPALHPYAGVANTQGVCELLRGEADFRSTIMVLSNGLHFLPAGKWTDEARQAAVGGRLEALISRLKEPFDCLVLHGHALLTVAESVEVASNTDVVLLCTLYRETRTPMLKKAVERIATMDVPHAGVVYLGATKTEALC
jgi:Mrp family chromosome partitioning ATPase/uncharacterized small protein (DUF1192 family)